MLTCSCLLSASQKRGMVQVDDTLGSNCTWHPLDLGLHPPSRPLSIYTYRAADAENLADLLRCEPSDVHSSVQLQLEAMLITGIQTSDASTDNPFAADFFFVPARPACLLNKGYTADEINALYKRAVESLPHFQISGGSDHVFAFTTKSGPDVFQDWCAHLACRALHACSCLTLQKSKPNATCCWCRAMC